MPSYLADIVAYHRRRAASATPDMDGLERAAAAAAPTRAFEVALRAPGIGVIAEVKRRSPSKGELAPRLDPAALAAAYDAGGASCLSVLTDHAHFGGSEQDLALAREAVAVPVLRKDFTVCEADVLETRAMGADAVLLIVAALSTAELGRYLELARSLGMAALVEVHDERELATALERQAVLIGVNQRDLRTFEVDPERAATLAALMPAGVVKVAESGIGSRADVERLEAAGYDAVLVGEALVRQVDPAAGLALLLGRSGQALRGPVACS
jgi:indole-3-glycerol phosphate synthase